MFVKNTEDDFDFHENHIQPIWCDNIYQDDAAWKQLGNITSHLVCPNTTKIPFSNDEEGDPSNYFMIKLVSCK